MNYLKIFCIIIFTLFFSLITDNYFSDNFLNQKELARKNYIFYLKKEIDKINVTKSQRNFKKFQDNSKYLKTNKEKEFWKLLKTK